MEKFFRTLMHHFTRVSADAPPLPPGFFDQVWEWVLAIIQECAESVDSAAGEATESAHEFVGNVSVLVFGYFQVGVPPLELWMADVSSAVQQFKLVWDIFAPLVWGCLVVCFSFSVFVITRKVASSSKEMLEFARNVRVWIFNFCLSLLLLSLASAGFWFSDEWRYYTAPIVLCCALGVRCAWKSELGYVALVEVDTRDGMIQKFDKNGKKVYFRLQNGVLEELEAWSYHIPTGATGFFEAVAEYRPIAEKPGKECVASGKPVATIGEQTGKFFLSNRRVLSDGSVEYVNLGSMVWTDDPHGGRGVAGAMHLIIEALKCSSASLYISGDKDRFSRWLPWKSCFGKLTMKDLTFVRITDKEFEKGDECTAFDVFYSLCSFDGSAAHIRKRNWRWCDEIPTSVDVVHVIGNTIVGKNSGYVKSMTDSMSVRDSIRRTGLVRVNYDSSCGTSGSIVTHGEHELLFGIHLGADKYPGHPNIIGHVSVLATCMARAHGIFDPLGSELCATTKPVMKLLEDVVVRAIVQGPPSLVSAETVVNHKARTELNKYMRNHKSCKGRSSGYVAMLIYEAVNGSSGRHFDADTAAALEEIREELKERYGGYGADWEERRDGHDRNGNQLSDDHGFWSGDGQAWDDDNKGARVLNQIYEDYEEQDSQWQEQDSKWPECYLLTESVQQVGDETFKKVLQDAISRMGIRQNIEYVKNSEDAFTEISSDGIFHHVNKLVKVFVTTCPNGCKTFDVNLAALDVFLRFFQDVCNSTASAKPGSLSLSLDLDEKVSIDQLVCSEEVRNSVVAGLVQKVEKEMLEAIQVHMEMAAAELKALAVADEMKLKEAENKRTAEHQAALALAQAKDFELRQQLAELSAKLQLVEKELQAKAKVVETHVAIPESNNVEGFTMSQENWNDVHAVGKYFESFKGRYFHQNLLVGQWNDKACYGDMEKILSTVSTAVDFGLPESEEHTGLLEPHPTYEYIEKTIRKFIAEQNKFGHKSFLLVGDSTFRSSISRWDTSRFCSAVVEGIEGATLWMENVSGSSFSHTNPEKSFLSQLYASTEKDWRYDVVLLVGGWNDGRLSEEVLRNMGVFHERLIDLFEVHAPKQVIAAPPGLPTWLEKVVLEEPKTLPRSFGPQTTNVSTTVTMGKVEAQCIKIEKTEDAWFSALNKFCNGKLDKVVEFLGFSHDASIQVSSFNVPKAMLNRRSPESTSSVMPTFSSKIPETNVDAQGKLREMISSDEDVAETHATLKRLEEYVKENFNFGLGSMTLSKFMDDLQAMRSKGVIKATVENEFIKMWFPRTEVSKPNGKEVPVKGTTHIGRLVANYSKTKKSVTTNEKIELAKQFGLYDEAKKRLKYVTAASGPEAMRKSLAYQLGRKRERTLDYDKDMLAEYASGQPFPEFEDLTLVDYFKELISSLDLTKGTAYSKVYDRAQTEKGKYWSAENVLKNSIRVLVTIGLVCLSGEDYLVNSTAYDKYVMGLLEPEIDFIKDEMHPAEKAESDRWRMIWNSAAHSEMVVRFLHQRQNKICIEAFQAGLTHSELCPHFGACPGMGHHDDGHKQVTEAMKRINVKSKADASGWDFSVTAGLWRCDGWVRGRLAEYGGFPPMFCLANYFFASVLCDHIVVIGQDLYLVNRKGIMGSGLASTSSSNSFMRAILHAMCYWAKSRAIARCLTMGDDIAAEDVFTKYEEEIAVGLGMICSDYAEVVNSIVDFTSHFYDLKTGTATFQNLEKLLAKIILGTPVTLEQTAGIMFAVRNNDPADIDRIRKAIELTGGQQHLVELAGEGCPFMTTKGVL